MKINFQVNGQPVEVDVPPMRRLLDVLREDLRLTGSKEGCGEGECGACSVLLDGESVCSCLIPVIQAQGHELVTVEGLANNEVLHAVQDAFLEHGAAQCGICTPGLLITAAELYNKKASPSAHDIREAMAGNLCRCTGYQKIIDAVATALSIN